MSKFDGVRKSQSQHGTLYTPGRFSSCTVWDSVQLNVTLVVGLLVVPPALQLTRSG